MEKPQDCGMLIKQIHDELLKNANNALRSQNITMTQLEVLALLNQAPEGRYSLKELEQLLQSLRRLPSEVLS